MPDEIIVVNDGGDPNLREMLLALPKKCPIIYARINQDILWNYNGAINLGFWISRGDLIAIEDTDHIPSRDAYENSIRVLRENPNVSRICFQRNIVDIKDVLSKPMAEWTAERQWGPNQMVSILRREVYSKMKGQDERFCGQYGWMTYDWVFRYKKMAKIESQLVNSFWAVIDGGEPGLVRGMSPKNYGFYQENARLLRLQPPGGILNFTYTIETL